MHPGKTLHSAKVYLWKKKRVEVSHSKSRQLCFQIASKHNKNSDKMIIQIKEYINFQYTTEIIKKTLKDAYYD